jgi:hypothetical protein
MRASCTFSAILTLLALAFPVAGANLKLYTTDGDYQIVREYQVTGDRVKFYSVDRSEWEEVPLALVDLKKTEAEAAAKKEVLDRQTKQSDEEVAAARAEREELAKIPQDSGVYRIENGALRTFPVADFTVNTPKGNTALRVLSPLPIIVGKSTVEIAGDHSKNVVSENRPEFYFQLDNEESFGIIRLKVQKNLRIAEQVDIIPITKEMVETRDMVKVFTKQLPGDNFYKIWPEEPLAAGEYALIEYEDGKVELRLWDFRIE